MAQIKSWDWDAPLARAPGESAKSNAALQDYVDLGPGRSLRELCRCYRGEVSQDEPHYGAFRKYSGHVWGEGGVIPPSRNPSTLEKWSADGCWQARLARYEQIQLERREAIREARRDDLEDMDWANGGELRGRVMEFLGELPKFLSDTVQEVDNGDGTKLRVVTVKLNASISQLSQALKTATELQRLSINEPTDITEVHGAALLAELASELDGLAAAGEAPGSEPDVDLGAESTSAGDPTTEVSGSSPASPAKPGDCVV